MPKIFGVRNMQFTMNPQEVPVIDLSLVVEPGYNPNFLYEFDGWDDMFPGDVIIPCQYCKQWGARKTACRHCGGAIE